MDERISEKGHVRDTGEEAGSSSPFQCPRCKKCTKSRAALQYHMQAVHGTYEVRKPSWAANASVVPGSGVGEVEHETLRMGEEACSDHGYECSVCGMSFSSELELSAHSEGGFQPTEEKSLLYSAHYVISS